MRIERPCTEDLDAMARTPSGGFACTRCEREVVDLRRASRKRALAVLTELRARGGSVCARVRAKADGTPLFHPDPSRFAGLAAPIALAGALAACSPPPPSIARGATPITLADTSSGGDNQNGPVPIAVTQVAPAPAPASVPTPGSANVRPAELELAGEMIW